MAGPALRLAQVRALAPVDGVAVVLLDQDRATSRVVFFWEASGKLRIPWESAEVPDLPAAETNSL